MIKGLRPLTRFYLGLVAFSLFGALLTRATGRPQPFLADLFGAITLLVAVAAVFQPVFEGRSIARGAAAIVACALFGGGAELIGVVTSFPFGRYTYAPDRFGRRWWPTLTFGSYDYAILVPFAWVLVVGGSYLVVRSRSEGWRAVVLAAILATAVDFAMEPVMTGVLGYWHWADEGPLPGGAPWTNSLGWFAVACAIATTLRSLGVEAGKSREPAVVLLGHLLLVFGLGVVDFVAR